MLSPYTQILAGRVLLSPAAGTEKTAEDEFTSGVGGDDGVDAGLDEVSVRDDVFDANLPICRVTTGGVGGVFDAGLHEVTARDDGFDAGWRVTTGDNEFTGGDGGDDTFDTGLHEVTVRDD
jgi:hypothetical protein